MTSDLIKKLFPLESDAKLIVPKTYNSNNEHPLTSYSEVDTSAPYAFFYMSNFGYTIIFLLVIITFMLVIKKDLREKLLNFNNSIFNLKRYSSSTIKQLFVAIIIILTIFIYFYQSRFYFVHQGYRFYKINKWTGSMEQI